MANDDLFGDGMKVSVASKVDSNADVKVDSNAPVDPLKVDEPKQDNTTVLDDQPVVTDTDTKTDVKLSPTQTSELLNKFGDKFDGKSIDVAGNLLNDKGEVIKTYADLMKEDATPSSSDTTVKEDEVLEIENEDGTKSTYKVDVNGNAINDDGTTAFTKEQLETFSDVDETPVANFEADKVYELTGVKITDDNDQPVEYDFTTPQGIANYAKDLNTVKLTDGINQGIDNFFKTNPSVYQAFMYERSNGNMEGFTPSRVWKDVELKPENTEQLEDVVINAELARGASIERAKAFVQYAKDDGKLESFAKNDLDFLIKNDETKQAEAAAVVAQERAAAEQAQAQLEQFVISTVQQGEVGNFTIPEKFKITKDGKDTVASRDQFVDYFLTPAFQDKDGKKYSQYEAEVINLKVEDKLIDAMLKFTGGSNSDQFVQKEINKQKVRKLRKASTRSVTTKKVVNATGKNQVKL